MSSGQTHTPRVINTIGPVRIEPLPDGRYMIYVESTPEHDARIEAMTGGEVNAESIDLSVVIHSQMLAVFREIVSP